MMKKVGDLVIHEDSNYGIGLVVEVEHFLWPDIEILWSDGEIERCDCHDVEVIHESR